MAYWKPLFVNGKQIDLSHLEPFEFRVVPKGLPEPARVCVSFNNHCFSESLATGHQSGLLPGTHVSSHEVRRFDPVRYELSKQLQSNIRGFDGKRIARTRTGPFVRINLTDGREYGIFFTLKKTGVLECGMFILSAYPLERPKNKVIATGEMKFNLAIALVLEGKKPKFPPGRF